jgi:predicted nucleic acid-binding protein
VTFAVDASVAGKLFFVEEYSDRALALFRDADRSGEEILAPHLLAAEFVNIVRRKMRQEAVTLVRASAAINELLALPLQYHAEPDIYREAILLTERYSLSASTPSMWRSPGSRDATCGWRTSGCGAPSAAGWRS